MNVEQLAQALHDLIEMFPDLLTIHKVELYLHRFTSFTDLFHLQDDSQAWHIELIIVFTNHAELWPGIGDQQKVVYDQFLMAASDLSPKLVVPGTRGWTKIPVGRDC